MKLYTKVNKLNIIPTTGKIKDWKKVFNISKKLTFFLKFKKDRKTIENAFTKRSIRVVNKAYEIKHNNKVYLVPKYEGCSLAHRKVEIRENQCKI